MIPSRATPRSRLIVLSLVILVPALACEDREVTDDARTEADGQYSVERPCRTAGPGEAGTPYAHGLPFLEPYSVNGTDLAVIRAATQRAIETGVDPRLSNGCPAHRRQADGS